MTHFYHFIKKDGQVLKSMVCHGLKLFKPGDVIHDTNVMWGDDSDGTKILAYSILKDALGVEMADLFYQKLVKEVLAPLSLNEWKITKTQLDEFCDYHGQLEASIIMSLQEGSKPENSNRPTIYKELPSYPEWIADVNKSLVVSAQESLNKN